MNETCLQIPLQASSVSVAAFVTSLSFGPKDLQKIKHYRKFR